MSIIVVYFIRFLVPESKLYPIFCSVFDTINTFNKQRKLQNALFFTGNSDQIASLTCKDEFSLPAIVVGFAIGVFLAAVVKVVLTIYYKRVTQSKATDKTGIVHDLSM